MGGDWKTGEPHDDSTPGTTLVSWVRSAQTSQPLEKTLIVGTDTDRRERTPVFETDARSATPSRASTPPAPAPPPVTPVPPAPPPVPAATPSATGTTPPAPAAERKSGVLVFLLAGAGLALAGAGAAVLLLRQKEPSVPPPSVVVQTDDAALEAIRKRLEEEKTAADRKTQELLAEKRRADEAEAERRKLEAAEADRQKQAAEVKAKRQSAATALWDAALADRQAKRFEDAKQKLEEILKTYPDATQAAEARQMIPSLVRKGLRLESDPAGATVTLNGKPCATPTPVFLEDQPEGTYEIAFSRPGYAEARQKTAHRAGEDTIVRVALKPLRGVLVVRTGVAGARVILREASGNPLRTETAATDGVVRLGELPVGAYTLRVEGDRHLPLERPVDVKPETAVDVPLTLQELPADVGVTSDPPAGTVYLDGQEKGKTPLRLSQVPPGRHVLKVTHPESFDHEEQLVLRGQSNPPVEVRLQPRGRLLISAHPAEGTTVRVDGLGPDRVGVAERSLDGSELTLPVKPGRYAVVFKHAEAGTKSVETGVKAGEGVKVSADLWAAKGQELEVRGDTAGAIAAYEKSRAPSLAQTIKDRIRQQHEERQQQQQEMERKALGLKQDGEAALKAGRLPEAEAKLAEYCRAKPDDAEAAGWLAFVRGIPEGMTFTGRNAQGFEECLNRKDESTMVLIPAGEFIMGANDGERDEKPMRRVYLDAYLMDKLEISWGQFKAFCKEVSRPLPSAPAWGIQDDHPVVLETWDDAKAYCAWAGKRLPTEAEWEKGARGTDGRKYPWGNAWDPQKANTKRLDLDKTVPRGSYPPGASPWGLLDMAGNACEWCEDWFEPYSVQAELRNPKGPETGRYRVLRGGSWHETEDFARCSARFKKAPTAHDRIITFRGVRDLRK